MLNKFTLRALFFLLILTNNPLGAQDNSWGLLTLSFYDNPMEFSPIEEIDLRGSDLDPRLNFGQLFMIERSQNLRPQLNIVFGGGIGYKKFKINFLSSKAFLGNALGRDIEDSISSLNMQFLSVHAGISYTKELNSKLFYSFTLRAGAIYSSRASLRYGYGVSIDNNTSIEIIDGVIIINNEQRIFPLFIPELSLNYKLEKVPLNFNLGISSLIVPGSIPTGKITLLGENGDYEVSVSDEILSLGLTLGVSYLLSQ